MVGELGQERGHEVLADRVEHVAHDEDRHPGGDLARRDQAQGGGHDHRDHVGHEEQPLLGPREIRQGPDQRRDHRHQGQGDDARGGPELAAARLIAFHHVVHEVQLVHRGEDDERERLVGEVEHRPAEDFLVQPASSVHGSGRHEGTKGKRRSDEGWAQLVGLAPIPLSEIPSGRLEVRVLSVAG